MEWNTILLIICSSVALVGAGDVMFQLYRMTVIDANARGLKHPKLWGAVAMSRNNSSGLLMYLIGIRKYPILSMSESDSKEIAQCKKSAGAGLIFLTVGAIGMIVAVLL